MKLPVRLFKPANVPINELLLPVEFTRPARIPINELLKPVVLEKPASLPKNELSPPVALLLPALNYAERDRLEGRLSPADEDMVIGATRELLTDTESSARRTPGAL